MQVVLLFSLNLCPQVRSCELCPCGVKRKSKSRHEHSRLLSTSIVCLHYWLLAKVLLRLIAFKLYTAKTKRGLFAKTPAVVYLASPLPCPFRGHEQKLRKGFLFGEAVCFNLFPRGNKKDAVNPKGFLTVIHFQIPTAPGSLLRTRCILPTSHCMRVRGLIQAGLQPSRRDKCVWRCPFSQLTVKLEI